MDETSPIDCFNFGRQINRFRFIWVNQFLLWGREAGAVCGHAAVEALDSLINALGLVVSDQTRVHEEHELGDLQRRLFACPSVEFIEEELADFWAEPKPESEFNEESFFRSISGFLQLIDHWADRLKGQAAPLQRAVMELGEAVDQLVCPREVPHVADAVVRIMNGALSPGWGPPSEELIREAAIVCRSRLEQLLNIGVLADDTLTNLLDQPLPAPGSGLIEFGLSNPRLHIRDTLAAIHRRLQRVSAELNASPPWEFPDRTTLAGGRPSELVNRLSAIVLTIPSPIRYSAYRTPAEWKKLLLNHNFPASNSEWRNFRDEYGAERHITSGSRLVRFPLSELARAGVTVSEATDRS